MMIDEAEWLKFQFGRVDAALVQLQRSRFGDEQCAYRPSTEEPRDVSLLVGRYL